MERFFISESANVEVALDRKEIRELNDDPLAFAQSISKLSDLCGVIRWANRLYHANGKPPFSDLAYDTLKDELKERKPGHSLLKTVGHAVAPSAGRTKVKLPYPMFSLDKIKPEGTQVADWAKKNPGPYCESDKMDGASMEIVYDPGKPVKAYSRGDGTVGQDVSHIVPHLKVPQTSKTKLVVRGEAIMSLNKFKSFSDKYENPRNLATGVVNKIRGKHEAISHIDFIAYEIIEPRKYKPSAAMALLKKLGFKVPNFKVLNTLSNVTLSNLLTERKKRSHYEIDGLVIEQDKVNKRPPAGSHSPDYACAFKMMTEESVVTVKVIAVEWNASKHGAMKPRVNIEPTRLSGVTINYASGFNASFIKNGFRQKDESKGLPVRPIGPGAIVKVTRSGDVIPHIVEVVKGARVPDFPKSKFVWDGLDIKSTVVSDDSKFKQVESFFRTIGVENIGLGVVAKFAAIGLDTVTKILTATSQDFMRAEGVQERSAKKYYDSIHSKLSDIPLPTLMDASGVFGKGMGTRRCMMVVKKYPSILKDSDLPFSTLVNQITQVDGFSSVTAQQFALGLPKFNQWLKKIGIKPAAIKKVKRVGTALLGKTIVFTGFRDADLSQRIVANGGTVGSGVNKDTTVLLVKDPSSSSSKTVKAKQLGALVMGAPEFIRKYKV